MDMTTGIARASMDMASARVATEAQVAMLRNVMDMQHETMAMLLKTMGVGQNMNIQA